MCAPEQSVRRLKAELYDRKMQRGESACRYFERLLVEAGPFENNDARLLLKLFLSGVDPRWTQTNPLSVARLCAMVEHQAGGPDENAVIQILDEADASSQCGHGGPQDGISRAAPGCGGRRQAAWANGVIPKWFAFILRRA